MNRIQMLRAAWDESSNRDTFVSGLGYLSRDLWHISAGARERCFYCMGSMGSTIPLALGIAITRSVGRVICIEGDGSLLMNLGCIITAARYGPESLRVIISDNGVYESTGGQLNRPRNIGLAQILKGAGLEVTLAETEMEVRDYLLSPQTGPTFLIAHTETCPPNARINEGTAIIKNRFLEGLKTIN